MDLSSLRSTSAHVLVEPDSSTRCRSTTTPSTICVGCCGCATASAVSVTDGAGRWVLAVGGARWFVAGAGTVERDRRPRRREPTRSPLRSAMPKGDRLDWLVQKVTELGVDRLALLHADRSVVRWKPDRVESQLARLQPDRRRGVSPEPPGLASRDRRARSRRRPLLGGLRGRRTGRSSPRADGPVGCDRAGGWMVAR